MAHAKTIEEHKISKEKKALLTPGEACTHVGGVKISEIASITGMDTVTVFTADMAFKREMYRTKDVKRFIASRIEDRAQKRADRERASKGVKKRYVFDENAPMIVDTLKASEILGIEYSVIQGWGKNCNGPISAAFGQQSGKRTKFFWRVADLCKVSK